MDSVVCEVGSCESPAEWKVTARFWQERSYCCSEHVRDLLRRDAENTVVPIVAPRRVLQMRTPPPFELREALVAV